MKDPSWGRLGLEARRGEGRRGEVKAGESGDGGERTESGRRELAKAEGDEE